MNSFGYVMIDNIKTILVGAFALSCILGFIFGGVTLIAWLGDSTQLILKGLFVVTFFIGVSFLAGAVIRGK